MCARCDSRTANGGKTAVGAKAVHVKTSSWRLLAAQGLIVNAIAALMMSYARKGGSIKVHSAQALVSDYVKWLGGLEQP